MEIDDEMIAALQHPLLVRLRTEFPHPYVGPTGIELPDELCPLVAGCTWHRDAILDDERGITKEGLIYQLLNFGRAKTPFGFTAPPPEENE